MEREYVVSFVLVLAVIFIMGIIAYFYYPKIFKDVEGIAKDVFKYGKEEDNAKQTKHAIQALIDTLAKCQKAQASRCGCQIENKQKLPKGYRIFLRVAQDKAGKPSMVIYAFSKEDKIVSIKADASALKLEGLKLGVAYWAKCDNCATPTEGWKNFGDVFCVFNSEATGKNKPLVIKGDNDRDWATVFYKTQGVFFDQVTTGDFKEFKDIPNIVKVDNNRYCLMTTNLLRPGDEVGFKPIPLKSSDEAVKLVDVSQESYDVAHKTKPLKFGLKDGLTSLIPYYGPYFAYKKYQELKGAKQYNKIGRFKAFIKNYFDNTMKYVFDTCFESKTKSDEWRSALKGAKGMPSKFILEAARPFTWPMKSKDTKMSCENVPYSGSKTYWLDRLSGKKGDQVYASTDAVVREVCDKDCLPGHKTIKLENYIGEMNIYYHYGKADNLFACITHSIIAVGNDGNRQEVFLPPETSDCVQKVTGSDDWDMRKPLPHKDVTFHKIYRVIYYGNLETVNKDLKKGSEVKMGQVIGSLGNNGDKAVPWLDYRVSFYDMGRSSTKWERPASPYATFHQGLKRLSDNKYVGCSGDNLNSAINLEKNFDVMFFPRDFAYKSPKWSARKDEILASNPRKFRTIRK